MRNINNSRFTGVLFCVIGIILTFMGVRFYEHVVYGIPFLGTFIVLELAANGTVFVNEQSAWTYIFVYAILFGASACVAYAFKSYEKANYVVLGFLTGLFISSQILMTFSHNVFENFNEGLMILARFMSGIGCALIAYYYHKHVLSFGFAFVGSTIATMGLQQIIKGDSILFMDELYLSKKASLDTMTFLVLNLVLFGIGFYF